jgi:hypothetical protein
MAGLLRWKFRESNDVLELKESAWSMGDRPEISYTGVREEETPQAWRLLTKDLRYDSNDSREMLKGSCSLNRVRWLDVVDGDLLQNDLVSSLGDGWGSQHYSKRLEGSTDWEILTCAIDSCIYV